MHGMEEHIRGETSNVIPHLVSRRYGIELLEQMHVTLHRRRLKLKSNNVWLKARKKLVMVESMDCRARYSSRNQVMQGKNSYYCEDWFRRKWFWDTDSRNTVCHVVS